MDCHGFIKKLPVEELGQGGSTPMIGNHILGLDSDMWSRNEKSSYGNHTLFKVKLKVLIIH